MKTIYGLHDAGGEHLMFDAQRLGWVVVTEEIGADPAGRRATSGAGDYRHLSDRGLGVLVRLNYSHHGQGTIPTPDQYANFARRCAHFVEASAGATRWIVGNEPNHEQERPDTFPLDPLRNPSRASAEGQGNRRPILAWEYAACYTRCRDAIHAVPGHEHDEVLVAAIAPWNVSSGDWLAYFRTVLEIVQGGCDGFCLHTYTHGSDPQLVTSEAKMQPPYAHRRFEFRSYQDFLAAVPSSLRHLPVYITETDQDAPWADGNLGWVQAAYAEVDRWNRQPGTQKIRALVLYRWGTHDRWGIEPKRGVHEDFKAALAHNYPSPQPAQPAQPVLPSARLAQLEAQKTMHGEPHLTHTACSLHHVAAGRVGGDVVDDGDAFFFRQAGFGLLDEGPRFDDGVRGAVHRAIVRHWRSFGK